MSATALLKISSFSEVFHAWNHAWNVESYVPRELLVFTSVDNDRQFCLTSHQAVLSVLGTELCVYCLTHVWALGGSGWCFRFEFCTLYQGKGGDEPVS